MPNLTSVGISSGVPNSGTGTVSTIDALMADGGQVTLGATADAAVTAGATGSISAKLRSISRDIVANIVLAAGSNAIGKLAAQSAIGTNIGDVVSRGEFTTVTVSKTRPADTTAYASGDAWSDSTSAPTALTFSNIVDANGKSGTIEGLVVTSSQNNATLALQGELWLFDTAPTVINDNAAFTITDSEMNTLVAKIPFNIDSTGNTTSGAGGNSCQVIDSIGACVTTVSSRNLTGLVKVLNAYTPVSGEVLTFRLKTRQID